MWVRFTGHFEDHPHPRQVTVYKRGMRCNVVRRCAEVAIAAGMAEPIPAPTRDEAKEWLQANSRTG